MTATRTQRRPWHSLTDAERSALAARITSEGWHAVEIRHEIDVVRVKRADGSYVIVSCPADVAAALLALPALLERVERLERYAAHVVGVLDDGAEEERRRKALERAASGGE